jgi:hypothetical protein
MQQRRGLQMIDLNDIQDDSFFATAKSLGLEIPAKLLALADEVIE